MANIMITKRCNLRCAYCFANEFVDGDISGQDITMRSFQKILEFILWDGRVTKLGLIGGEPTLHPDFAEILERLIRDERAEEVTIYTNGILLKPYIEKLSHPKFHLLINCNDLSRQDTLFYTFTESLECVFGTMPDRAVLGVNFYKPDYDYTYILELLKRYPCQRLRLSISVPNTETYAYEPFDYFRQIKPKIFAFFRKLKELGTIPFLDCNIFPACLVTAEEMEEFEEWGCDNPLSVLKNYRTGCMPVIDILPDETAVRCFGLSEYTKAAIRDFASVSDLKNYYLRTVDAYAVNCYYNEQCAACYKYKTAKCYGGCLIYKIRQLLEKRKADGLVQQGRP